jgi:hypothetical protein
MKHKFCYLLFFLAFASNAEVIVVKDFAKDSDNEYTAKVLSTKMIIEHVPRLVSKKICEKVLERVHIDKYENVVKIIPNNMVSCKIIHDEEILNVVSGYQVTYEHKGKLVTKNMNYDPGEFVKVKN